MRTPTWAVALAACLLAAVVAPSSASAVDLRAVLQHHLKERQEASMLQDKRKRRRAGGGGNGSTEQRRRRRRRRRKSEEEKLDKEWNAMRAAELAVPGWCALPRDGRSTSDRLCESEYKQQATCGCKEVCHIWGDPHVAPFFSRCSTVSMTKRGRYTLYKVPEEGRDAGIHLEGTVEGLVRGQFKMVTEFYVDGEKKIDRFQCIDRTMDHYEDERVLMADDGREVTCRFSAACDFRHTAHLNITIEMLDSVTGAESADIEGLLGQTSAAIQAKRHPDDVTTVPDSTTYFDDDSGVCVDPLRYNTIETEAPRDSGNYGRDPFWLEEECKRASDASYDGRACSCGSQCAMYGDPHTLDFFTKQAQSASFMIPTGLPEQRIIYSVNPYFAAFIEVDSCAYIVKYHALYLREEDDPANPASYVVASYDAEELCSRDEDVDPETRKRILAPSRVSDRPRTDQDRLDREIFDATVGGFPTGTFVTLDGEALPQVVPRSRRDDIDGFVSSLSGSPTQVIHSGGVQAVLKCHTTREGTGTTEEQILPRRFFNVCIQRRSVVVDKIGETQTLSLTANRQSNTVTNLQTIERDLRSAGWCALGKESRTGFAHRAAGEYELPIFNPTATTDE